MLHPAIEIRKKGTIHGNGLFTNQLISKGEMVWQLDVPTYSWKEIEAFDNKRRKAFDQYGFQCGVDRFSLQEPDDISREANHSCDPNTWWGGSYSLVALRDIHPDEEITYDYSTCDIDIALVMKCNCGAPCCRKIITNRDYLAPEWQEQYGLNLPTHVLSAIERAGNMNAEHSNQQVYKGSTPLPDRKTILILRHRESKPMKYSVEHYALRWRDAGHRVIYHIGPDDMPEADVVILSIDLTIMPKEYIGLIQKYPLVINGQILDISRRRFSELILSKSTDYSGPVIIKTDANYGGLAEYENLNREDLSGYLSSTLNSILKRTRIGKAIKWVKSRNIFRKWDTVETLNPLEYPILEDISDVPDSVWENKNLVVERFIANSEDGLFYTNYCVFFGDKEIAGRLASTSPIVKFGNAVSDKETPIPDEVRQWREDLNIDYGRFDYVEADGKLFLIDVNKTEGGSQTNYQYPNEMDFLASGLEFFIGSE
ncbi:MAG: SET domain-containing protein-lysine N-methyltransferase [Balneolaceae bacterium]|nr:SET domain-containing protein-lysine N-methyltransferase [Balneolaceae bacterium]MDR9408439.1 SET domain-containing protein-lysine N-methyltransferase [Balneolaceae bacterium]